jgi:hypothetical protein
MEMMRMKTSKYKPIIFLSAVYCLMLIVFLSIDVFKERSNEIIQLSSQVGAFEFKSTLSNPGLKYHSVSENAVSTGVSHDVDDEEYF